MKKGNHTIELYDLDKDIGEENDLAAEHPDLVRRISLLMRSARTPSAEERWNRYLSREEDGP